MDVDPDHEEEFNRWYNEEHMSGLLSLPGVLSGRRHQLASDQKDYEKLGVIGIPKCLAVYEHQSIDVQKTKAYENDRSTPWTKRIISHCKLRVRNFYVQIFLQEGHRSG